MSAPTTLTVTLLDSSTVTINIPTAMQGLNSDQTASGQTGYSSVDLLISSIFQRGYFFDSTRTTAYNAEQVKSITWS